MCLFLHVCAHRSEWDLCVEDFRFLERRRPVQQTVVPCHLLDASAE